MGKCLLIYIAFLKFFYPDFIIVDNLIFLKEQYDESTYRERLKRGLEGSEIEYWTNLIYIEGFFELRLEPDEYVEHCEFMAQEMSKIWSLKLQRDFPDKIFKVIPTPSEEEEYEEIFITFYQAK